MLFPSEHQQKIIRHNRGHALVVAGPGSGKTTTLVERAHYLFTERSVPTDNICILVFNKDIATKLKQDIKQKFGNSDAPYTSTVHSFILSQTLKHGAQLLGDFEIGDNLGNLGVKELIFKPIARRLKEKHGITKTPDGKELRVDYIAKKLWNNLRNYWLTTDEVTDPLFQKFKYEVERFKNIFNVIFFDELAIKFLKEIEANNTFREAVKKEKIIIDEFQDLNPTEHALLKSFHDAGVEFMCFGDDDQAINEFRKANADLISGFKTAYSPTEYPLSRDRRCPKEILDLADSFVSFLPSRLVKLPGSATHKGKVDIFEFTDDEQERDNLPKIVSKFLEKSVGASKDPEVLILSSRLGGASNKSRIEEIVEALKVSGIEDISSGEFKDPLDTPCGLAFRGLLTVLNKPTSSLGLYIFYTFVNSKLVKESLKHLENEEQKGNSLSFFAAYELVKEGNEDVKRLISSIDGLREKLKSSDFKPDDIFELLPKGLPGEEAVKKLASDFWQQVRREADEKNDDREKLSEGEVFFKEFNARIADYTGRNSIKRIHVTTYRKAKGLEADLVIVTAVDNSEFSDTPSNRRLLYVATTRAKRNLIMTFASRRTKARRYTKGRPSGAHGNPNSYRSSLIPRSYTTMVLKDEWLQNYE